MDALEEGLAQDYDYAKQYQYVFCWTEEEVESIPQWSIYFQGMKGIRIGINVNTNNILDYFVTTEDPTMNRMSPSNLHFHKIVPYLSERGCPFIRKMKYTFEEQKLKPDLKIFEGIYHGIDMSKLAIHKSKVWEFQKEIRFLVSFSLSPIKNDFTPNRDFNLEDAFKTKTSPFEFIDLDLSESFFDNLEITYGRKCPYVHKELIEMFVKKFGFAPIIRESELMIARCIIW